MAPNGRPVQMTRDLRSFWERTYPDVRKELRGRYPNAPRDDRERDKAWQMLVRRGYSPDLSYDAIRSWERTERERRRAA